MLLSGRRGIGTKSGYLWTDGWMESRKEGRDRRKEREGRRENQAGEHSVAGATRLPGAGAAGVLTNFNNRFSGNKKPCVVVSVSFCGVSNPTRGDFGLPT